MISGIPPGHGNSHVFVSAIRANHREGRPPQTCDDADAQDGVDGPPTAGAALAHERALFGVAARQFEKVLPEIDLVTEPVE